MLLAALLLLASQAEAEPPPKKSAGFVAITGTALLPIDPGGWYATAALEAGFEPVPFLRFTFAGTFAVRFTGLLIRLMSGPEVVISPLLPLELTFGALVGFGNGFIGDVGGIPFFGGQLRATVGYRVTSWFTLGLIATGNIAATAGGAFYWLELGPRLAVRW